MDSQTLAGILLLGRIVAVFFIARVIHKQLKLFKFAVPTYINRFRKLLFCLSLVLLISNLAPIVIDVLAIQNEVQKMRGEPLLIGIIYACSNMVTSVISGLIVWMLYREAAKRTHELE